MEDWLQWVIAAVCLVVTIVLQAEVALLFIGAGIVGILCYGSLFRRTPAVLPAVAPPVLAQLAPAASSVSTSILGKLLLFLHQTLRTGGAPGAAGQARTRWPQGAGAGIGAPGG